MTLLLQLINEKMARISEVFQRIIELRKRYYQALPGKEHLISLINEAEISEHVYNSNAIENSTLSLSETEKVLLQIDLDRFISEREIFEAKNLARVVLYVDKKSKEADLNEEIILSLHEMLISNIRDDIAGRFRIKNEFVRVGSHIASPPDLIEGLISQMLTEYKGATNNEIIKNIAKLHLTFEHIHPFVDGNGRIGRLLNNYLLIREGFVPINIKFIDRSRYYDAFKEFDESKKTNIMEEIIGYALANSFHKRLAYLDGKRIIKLSDYAKENNLSYNNLLNKAKRQTIECFMEKGIWKIGV
jgi:Fic family protein